MTKHCVEKIVEIVNAGRDDRRSILQLGYNLGRLGELTGLGREPFWDRWKDAVSDWNLDILRDLAGELGNLEPTSHAPSPNQAGEREPGE